MTHSAPLARRLLAEYLGSAFLAAVVIGSGIAASQLSPDDTGLALLENAAATAAGLFTIILMFGPVSGGHFNPVVSLVDAHFGGLTWREALAYIPAQCAGCITGVHVAAAAAHLEFRLHDLSEAPFLGVHEPLIQVFRLGDQESFPALRFGIVLVPIKISDVPGVIRVQKEGIQPDADYRMVQVVLFDCILDLLLQRLVCSPERWVHGNTDDLFGVRRQFDRNIF